METKGNDAAEVEKEKDAAGADNGDDVAPLVVHLHLDRSAASHTVVELSFITSCLTSICPITRKYTIGRSRQSTIRIRGVEGMNAKDEDEEITEEGADR